jgi:trehalose/maltose hydrolase-like predicted phosphorylase
VTWLQNNFTSNLIKPPFNVRTETASNNSGYFITSSGGFVQNLVYGFTGLRIQDKGLVGAYAPVLPPAWKSMTLTDIAFRGKHYDITIDRDANGRATLTRKAL